MYEITKEFLAVPVTCLHFCGDLLLSGEGSHVVVYDQVIRQCLGKTEVFKSSNVHGITSEKKAVAVFGGKSLCFLLFNPKARRLEFQQEELVLSDWIQTVQWLSERHTDDAGTAAAAAADDDDALPQQLAAALSHNVVVLVDTKTGNFLEEIHCEDICILYSAHFIGSQWRHLVLAAGTVFNQIVIWPVMGKELGEGSVRSEVSTSSVPVVAKVMHRLDRHQGVIFSITTHSSRRLLCSVSDDRSIHLWKVACSDTDLELCDWTVSNWASATFDLVHILYGHKARVWQAVLLSNGLVSVGEDSCCIHWSYDGQIQKRVKGHKGRSIWSVACSKDEKYLATGGGDTSIRISVLHPGFESGSTTRWRSRNLGACKNQDHPKTVHFVGDGKILLMTDEGHLQYYDSDMEAWCTVVTDQHFRSYCVIDTTSRATVIAMGSLCGSVKLLSLDGIMELQQQLFNGKVLSLSLLEPKDEERMRYLLANGPDGILIFQKLLLSQRSWIVSETWKFYLPPKKQCWLTAACMLEDVSLLLCGDRGGTLHVYDLSNKKDCDKLVRAVQNFPRIHSKAGLTDICFHNKHVYTCGRDGHYRMYQVTPGRLHLLQANRVMKGMDWLTRFTQLGENLIILGFYMEQLIVYDLSQSELLAAVPCGGGHRAWDFILSEETSGSDVKQINTNTTDDCTGSFIYIKKKDVVLCDVQLSSPCNVLKPPLHGREINDVHCLFGQSDKQRGTVLATAGEDNVINVVQWNQTDADLQNLHVIDRLQGHISSVRCLATSRSYKSSDSTRATVLLSGGGRAQLMAWRIWLCNSKWEKSLHETSLKTGDKSRTEFTTGPSHSDIVSTRWHHLSEQLANHVIIEDGGLRKSRTWRCRDCVLDPETRIMSMTVFPLSDLDGALPPSGHLIAAGCSDAVLRFFTFDEITTDIHCIGQSSFHQHCILKVTHLLVSSSSSSSSSSPSSSHKALILSAATDGRIALWDVTSLIHVCTRRTKMEFSSVYDEQQEDECEEVHSKDKSCAPTVCTNMDTSQRDYQKDNNNGHLRTPSWWHQCHQSGVNSLDTRKLSGLTYLVASGGDDNAVCLLVIKLTIKEDTKFNVDVLKSHTKRDAHAAQVTGIKIVEDDLLLSASIDQRVILWKVNHEDLQLTQTCCVFLNVADISQLNVWRSAEEDTYLGAVCGVGLQGLSIRPKL